MLEVDWKFGERSAVEVERAGWTGGASGWTVELHPAKLIISSNNSQDGPDNQRLGEHS